MAFLANARANAGVSTAGAPSEPRRPVTASTGETTPLGAAASGAAHPDADPVGDNESRHETAHTWRNRVVTAAERPTLPSAANAPAVPAPPATADRPEPATSIVVCDTGGSLASPATDATTVTHPAAGSAPPTPMPWTGNQRPEVPQLGVMLLKQRLVTRDQLKRAMERQKRTRRRLGRVLVEMGFTTEDAVLEALSAQLGVPSTRVNSFTVNPESVQCLSEKVARKHMAFPLLKVGSTLVVAIASPKDLHALDDLRFASGCGIQMMVAMETEIQAALDKYYGNTFGPADAEEIGTVVIDIPGPQVDLHDEVAERSAVSLVERIIAKAAADRASDIHLEPSKNSLRVRFWIDGTFHEAAQLLLGLAPAVLARVSRCFRGWTSLSAGCLRTGVSALR